MKTSRRCSLWDYRGLGNHIDIIAMYCMVGAKHAVSDGYRVWLSPAMYDLFVKENDDRSRELVGKNIKVITVRDLRQDYRVAFDL